MKLRKGAVTIAAVLCLAVHLSMQYAYSPAPKAVAVATLDHDAPVAISPSKPKKPKPPSETIEMPPPLLRHPPRSSSVIGDTANVTRGGVTYATVGRCHFTGCPASQPFLYFVTSYRNRADAYDRFVRTLADDMESSKNNVDPRCICLAVADYDDVVVGPPIGVAMREWPHSKAVVRLTGAFSRAGGLQHAIDALVTTPRDKSIAFLVDCDMVIYPGFTNTLAANTILGRVSAPTLLSPPPPLSFARVVIKT